VRELFGEVAFCAGKDVVTVQRIGGSVILTNIGERRERR